MDVTLLLERLDALSLRERVMVSVAIAAVCGAAMQFLLLDPLLASADRIVRGRTWPRPIGRGSHSVSN